jgi:pectinesterase
MQVKKKMFFFGLSFIMVASTFAQKYDVVVAQDGSGNYTTVQAAINAVPDLQEKRTRIYIKAGVYKEKLMLPATKTNVSFVGEDAQKTVLTYDDFAAKQNSKGAEIGTSKSASFFVNGNGFTAENITFENSSGPVGQAVAVRIDGDKVIFRNCRFLGFQDTLYPHGDKSRQYYKNCYIEGTVDFIFGLSTALFEDCTIFCKKQGYITAASTPESNPYGFVFRHCKITGSAPACSFFLGRPWRPYAKVVFLECELGNVINPQGWHKWNNTQNDMTAYYAEYHNTGAGADTHQRVNWSKILTSKDAKLYQTATILRDWKPQEK